MNQNKKILSLILVALVALTFVALIFYYFLRSESLLPLTEEQKMQALIDSTTAPANSTPLSEEELKKLIDSTTVSTNSTPLNKEELKKLIDSTTMSTP